MDAFDHHRDVRTVSWVVPKLRDWVAQIINDDIVVI